MSHAPSLAPRAVLSHDPSLSMEANGLLTRELRSVLGRDSVDLPPGSADHAGDRHGTHSSPVVGAIEMKLMLAMIGLMFLVVGGVVLVATTGYSMLVPALLLFIPTTTIVALMIRRMTEEFEHLSPETAAVLAHEGVGDPDRVFSELIADFRGREGDAATR